MDPRLPLPSGTALLAAALAVLLWGCGSAPQAPVPLVGVAGDIAALTGQWEGSYASAATGRSGSISFSLTALGGPDDQLRARHRRSRQRDARPLCRPGDRGEALYDVRGAPARGHYRRDLRDARRWIERQPNGRVARDAAAAVNASPRGALAPRGDGHAVLRGSSVTL